VHGREFVAERKEMLPDVSAPTTAFSDSSLLQMEEAAGLTSGGAGARVASTSSRKKGEAGAFSALEQVATSEHELAEQGCCGGGDEKKTAAAPAPAPPPAMPDDFGEIAGGGGDRKKQTQGTRFKQLAKMEKSDLVKKDIEDAKTNVARKTDDQITKGKDVHEQDESTSTLEVVTVTEHRPTRQEWSPPQTTDGGASRATDTRGRPEASGAGTRATSFPATPVSSADADAASANVGGGAQGAGSVLELGSASPRLASRTEPRGGDDVRSGAESADFAPVSSFIRALEETETPRSNVATATKTRQKTSNLRGGAPRSGKEAAFREEQ